MCAFLGMKSPRNGLIMVLEGVVFHYSRNKVPFGDSYYIFLFLFYFILTILFKNAKLRIKNKIKDDP